METTETQPLPRQEDELSIVQAAVILDVSDASVRAYVKQGKLSSRPGAEGGLLVKRPEVEALRDRRAAEGGRLAPTIRPKAIAPRQFEIDTLAEYTASATRFLELHNQWIVAQARERELHTERASAQQAMARARKALDARLAEIADGQPAKRRKAEVPDANSHSDRVQALPAAHLPPAFARGG